MCVAKNNPIMSALTPECAYRSLSCQALRSHSLSALPNHFSAYTPTCLEVIFLPGTAIRLIDCVVPSCQDGGTKSSQPPLWLAVAVENRLIAARVAQEVWGRALFYGVEGMPAGAGGRDVAPAPAATSLTGAG